MYAVHSYVLFYLAAQCFLKIITRASVVALLSIDTIYQLEMARCQSNSSGQKDQTWRLYECFIEYEPTDMS